MCDGGVADLVECDGCFYFCEVVELVASSVIPVAVDFEFALSFSVSKIVCFLEVAGVGFAVAFEHEVEGGVVDFFWEVSFFR